MTFKLNIPSWESIIPKPNNKYLSIEKETIDNFITRINNKTFFITDTGPNIEVSLHKVSAIVNDFKERSDGSIELKITSLDTTNGSVIAHIVEGGGIEKLEDSFKLSVMGVFKNDKIIVQEILSGYFNF